MREQQESNFKNDISNMDMSSVAAGFANQVAYCRANDAPITARVVAAIARLLPDPQSGFARRIAGWTGHSLADALPLRAAAAFHALYLDQTAPELASLYAELPAHHARTAASIAPDSISTDSAAETFSTATAAATSATAHAIIGSITADNTATAAEDAAIIAAVASRHDGKLLPWLDGPPQTNESGRSANFIAAMLWLVDQGCPARFEVMEIGSSAGINLMMDRYHYDLGEISVGPQPAVLQFQPEWRGSAPPRHELEFSHLRGCDIHPVNLGNQQEAARIKAYIWPEHHVRFQRLEAAIAAAQQSPPDLVQAEAADFVEAELARPQEPGSTRVLMHSIVWQYLPKQQQERITAAMERAGANAAPDKALAWIRVEGNRTVHVPELTVRHWPAHPAPQLLAHSHPHGAWIDWKS